MMEVYRLRTCSRPEAGQPQVPGRSPSASVRGSGSVPLVSQPPTHPVSENEQPLFRAKPPAFAVIVEQDDGRILVRASGELDLATVPALEKAMTALDDGKPTGLLDMSAVTFMDSTGLRLLIVATEQAQAAGRTLSIVPSRAVTKVVEAVGLKASLPLIDPPVG
jgi:anti-sigma B factor antagonist